MRFSIVPLRILRAVGVTRVLSISCAFSSWSALGCLADPPIYETPERIPPIIDWSRIDPPHSTFVELADGQSSVHFTVPFRSEDLGSVIVAQFLLDDGPHQPNPVSLARFEYAPATLDDSMRQVSEDVSGFGSLRGCHTVTLMMTHAANTNSLESKPIDASLATRIVWWVAVPQGAESGISLSECPTLGGQNIPDSPQ